jgi:hypothetical protein
MRPVSIVLALLALTAPSRTNVRLVRAGEDLQAALNAARAGDEIRLAADATFTGNFVLPVFNGDDPVTLRTDLPDASLPPADHRVTPAAAARFARIVSPNNVAALRTAPGAHHWTLVALVLPNNKGGFGDIVLLGDGSEKQTDLAQVPHDLVLDRLYIHGDPELGQKRGIALNARAVTVKNCYISDIKAEGMDTQAIAGWNGPGPFVIENNYLEAAGEVFLLGGADPAIAGLIPSDVVFRYNHLTRPMSWRGTKWQIKNLFELKNARRVIIDSNLMENNWVAAQPGWAVLFTVRNQSGQCPWCTIEDVEFANNVVRNTSAAVNILGHDSPAGPTLMRNLHIHNNLFTGITTRLGGEGWGVLVGDGPRDLVIEHNTFEFDGTTVLYAYGSPKLEGFRFVGNAAPHGTYGINGAGASTGTLTFQMFFEKPVVTGNWLSGGSSSRYPPGNRFDSPFDPSAAGSAGADLARLRALADAIPKGVMPAATSSTK